MRKKRVRSWTSRALALLLIPGQLLLAVPAQAWPWEIAVGSAADDGTGGPPLAPPEIKVNRTVPKVDPISAYPIFSEHPSEEEIFRARVFGEPLIPAEGTPSGEENKALADAVTRFLRSPKSDRYGHLEEFLKQHSGSAWRASLLMNLGAFYRRKGYFGRANGALREAWELAQGIETRNGRAIADGALKELLEMHDSFGHVTELEDLVTESEGRPLLGSAVQMLSQAKASLWIFANKHEEAIPSGPVALAQIRERLSPGSAPDPEIAAFHADMDGATLVEMRDLAKRTGLSLQIALRPPGAKIPLPALIHLRGAHFSAIVAEEGGQYLLDDPLLSEGGSLWIDREALEEEATGFFLIREGALPKGWTQIADDLAKDVRGKCKGVASYKGATKPGNNGNGGGGGGGGNPPNPNPSSKCQGMATYSFQSLLANLHLEDVPVGYTPPRGPSVQFRVTYNHKEYYQPLIFSFANLGTRWNFDWLAYIEDDPQNLSADVNLQVRGGGRDTFTGFDGQSYAPHRDSQAMVTRISTSPIKYEHLLSDGSKEVYAQSDGAMSSPRRVFLTEVIDPQGNKLTFTYDAQLRLVSVTDAIGQVTTLSYDLGTDPLKVTKVTDPFGRFATLTYGNDGQLASITDVIGIKSAFSYGNYDFVNSLTTPYGTTSFAVGYGPINYFTDYYVEATDPLGGKERLERIHGNPNMPPTEPPNTVPPEFGPANIYMNNHSSYYFDKRAMALYAGDYTKAQVTRWNNSDLYTVWDSAGSTKLPLENRVWYEYASAPFIHGVGAMNKPIKVARVLDDGSAQITQMEYNSKGLKTREIDPLGRETVYEYDSNEIDLLRVKVKNGASWDQVQSYTYNAQHQPLTVTDGAGQTTTYTYTATRKIQTMTTPPRAGINEQRTTTYAYESGTDKLLSVTAPGNLATSLTYDGYGRLRTTTNSDNYTVTFDYDALDRPTRTTYPDGTYNETVYDRLDPAKRRDRMGRWTQTFYDALRRVTATRDPAGRVVIQQWCTCGSLDKLVDPNGNATTWERDAEGRITKEVRPNGSFKQFVYENTTGRLKKTIDAKNQEIQYTYALDDKPTQVTYVNEQYATPDVSFSYTDPSTQSLDPYGRLRQRVDGTGTTAYTYHPFGQLGAGQLASIDGPLANDTISYGYDELGRVVSRTLNGVTSTWSHDQQGRLTSLVDPIGTITHTYDGNSGRTATVSYPNGQTTTYNYFPNSGDRRLQEIHHKKPGGATLNEYNYTYDVVGNIKAWTQQTDTNPAQAFDLEYDPVDQLTAGTLKTTGAPPQILKRYRYAYDPAGNRTAEQIDDAVAGATHDNMNRLLSQQPGGTLSFRGTVSEPSTVAVQGQAAAVDPSNQFTGSAPVPSGTSNVVVAATDPSGNLRTNTYQVTASGATRSFAYDANGNLSSMTEGSTTTTYEWDAENRLTAVKQGATTLASFTYDGDDRRSQKSAAGLTTTYVYDGADILEERPSAGATRRHVHGPGVDKPFASVEGGAATYFVADHLGSVVRMTDAAGNPTLTREYDPWGNLLTGSGTSGYAFTGREWDAETSLYYYRARYYDSRLGRFLGEDPIGFGDGIGRYLYVHANPVNLVDPTGLKVGGTVINLATCCALVSSNNPAGPGQKQSYIPPKSSKGPFADVDAIYFKDGSAIKIPDLSIFWIYDCEALEKYNGSKPFANGAGPYTVTFLPDYDAAAKEFGGPIIPPDPDPACRCKK